MYKVTMELKVKKDMTLKESYEKIAILVRLFINKNDKELKKTHYQKVFSYYSFSNMFPLERSMIYKKGNIYTVELRSLKKEFLDLKSYNQLETDDLELLSASGGKLYYRSKGKIFAETPAFFNTRPIDTEEDLRYVKEKVRENILFRYLKSGMNQSDDIHTLRKELVKEIHIENKTITIPFGKKVLKNGKCVLYHCLKINVEFNDNEFAKEAEKIIYAGGIGKNTSNGFGFIQ